MGNRVILRNEQATEELAQRIAELAQPGDVICLKGDLGVGKTFFAKCFIAHLTGLSKDNITSPTFTLVQTYDADKGTIWHFDLYRIDSLEACEELGYEDAFDTGITLIEWPEILEAALPVEQLELAFFYDTNKGERLLQVKATGHWQSHIDQLS